MPTRPEGPAVTAPPSTSLPPPTSTPVSEPTVSTPRTTLPVPTLPPAPGRVTTTTTAPAPPANETVTTSAGGTVYTRCTGPDSIAFVAAVPKNGFERVRDVETGRQVVQEFASDAHRSTISVECSDGRAHAEVEEESNE